MKKSVIKKVAWNMAYKEAKKLMFDAYPDIQGWAASSFLEQEYEELKKQYEYIYKNLRRLKQ